MKLTVKSQKFDYDIHIKNHLLDDIENYLDINKNYIIISDDLIPSNLIRKVTYKLKNHLLFRFPHGESSKSIKEYSRLMNEIIDTFATRDITIIALGGGVTGDLVGFIAATLYRGVDYIQIPTTLLSQIDSSIGGKVAINSNSAKNSIGCFYPPKKVLIDPATLDTLDERQFNNGMAEMIKYGMIYSQELFAFLKTEDIKANIEKLIFESLKIKKFFVENDEFDHSLRQVLNFGHTYGHAYEAYYNYQKYLHGEAVSLGMMKAVDKSLIKELFDILSKFSLPTFDEVEQEKLLEYIKKDKKNTTNFINFIKVDKIGEAYVVQKKLEEL
jgi:3-dehydroquinate synthase